MGNGQDPLSKLDCQVEWLSEAGERPALTERLARFVARAGYKLITDPEVVLRRLRRRLRLNHKPVHRRIGSTGSGNDGRAMSLGLVPGEVVEVRSAKEIRTTLDQHGRCGGLAYMPSVMDRYCCKTYRVRRRIDRFFDERRGRLMKLRDVVILENVYCEPPDDPTIPFASCDRSCFLFWKEAWLRRA